jgi:hypothetical protein
LNVHVLVSVMGGLFRNVYEDDWKICEINYDGDLQKYNYLYLFEEIEKLSHLVWDGVPNKFYYLVEKFFNSFIKFLSFLSICYLVLGSIL